MPCPGSSTTRTRTTSSTRASCCSSHPLCPSGKLSPCLCNHRYLLNLSIFPMFYVLTISLHLPIIHYNLVQVWLATLLSFVVVTVAYALLTRHSWSKDPSFAFVDSECSYNLCHLCCWNGSHHMSWRTEERLVPAPLFPSLLSFQPIYLYLAFVFGNLIDQSKHFHFIFLPNMSYIYLFSICAGHSDWPVPEPLFYLFTRPILPDDKDIDKDKDTDKVP